MHISESEEESDFHETEKTNNVEIKKEIISESSSNESSSDSDEETEDKSSSHPLEELCSDDEIFTLQCPKQMTVDALEALQFTSHKNKTIFDKKANSNFIIDKFDNDKFVTCILNNRTRIKVIPVHIKGHLLARRQIPAEPNNSMVIDNMKSPKFPSNLKERHPLLGVDWKTAINESSRILKKSKRRKIQEKMDGDNVLVKKRSHEITEETEPPKKKRKSK